MKKEKPKLPLIFRIFEVIGPLLLVPGLIGFIIFFINPGEGPWFPISAICMPAGLFLSFFGYIPLIQKTTIKAQHYVINENKETLTDLAETQADIASPSAKKITKSVAEGFKEGIEPKVFCKHCGKEIDADSKFCRHCGKEQ